MLWMTQSPVSKYHLTSFTPLPFEFPCGYSKTPRASFWDIWASPLRYTQISLCATQGIRTTPSGSGPAGTPAQQTPAA